MLSAPPIIPATTQGTFSCAFTPHRRRTRTCSSTRSPRPARCASAITGTSPARDTKFGSSNVAWIFAKSCNNRTCEVSSPLGTWKSQQLPSSQFRGHLPRRRARISHYSRGGLRLRDNGHVIERYTLPEMCRVWSQEHKYELWCRVETLVLEAHADAGTMPAEVVAPVRAAPPPTAEAVAAAEAVTDHDVIAFLTA